MPRIFVRAATKPEKEKNEYINGKDRVNILEDDVDAKENGDLGVECLPVVLACI